MPMLIYKPLQATPTQFVKFWSLRYVYAEENLYNDSIGHELTEQRIYDLFKWKNGTRLSNRKRASVHRSFVERRGELEQLQPNQKPNDLLAHFPDGGAIWRIFWLHCWQPRRFPIYDQHVHRAMAFIQTGALEEIPGYDPRKIGSYIRRYLPFHATFDGIDSRSVDKALWAFGKFLKEANFPTVAVDSE
jgi:hypothetical protein